MQVLLALHGDRGRLTTSKWLQQNGVITMEASEWNGLTQILRELFHARSPAYNNGFDAHYPLLERLKSKFLSIQELTNPTYVIAVDIGLLDLSTDIWKEQLNFLHKYHGRAKFVWVLNHDNNNTIKMELRKKGHILTVNKPLYKTKMIHVLEAVIKEKNVELQRKNKEGDLHESLEIDYTHCDLASSDGSDISEMGGSNFVCASGDKQREEVVRSYSSSQYQINNCLVGLAHEHMEHNTPRKEGSYQSNPNSKDVTKLGTFSTGEDSECGEMRRANSSSRADRKAHV